MTSIKSTESLTPKIFTRGDIDGFFGLFVDNLLQLMLIKLLCEGVLNMPAELISGRILPAAAISIVIGNVFYGWQARKLMIKEGREDVTALPYGINTPSLFVYIFFVMLPVYSASITKNPEDTATAVNQAWRAGLFACFGSAIIEIIGAFCGDWLRKNTPRAALLSALAGIAITFISLGFIFQIFANPGLGLLPMFIMLVCFASRRFSRLPAGLVGVLVGIALAWLWKFAGVELFSPPQESYSFAFHLPAPVLGDLFAYANQEGMAFMGVIIPMGLFNVIGSLQNLESAEAAGDRFATRPSLLANGIGTLGGAILGSCFPTTIYIGHPGWKAMGSRAGYSTLNAVVIAALCLTGGVTLMLKFIPMEGMLGILLWIGIIITAQAFKDVPKRHNLAVAMGLIPALGAWTFHIIRSTWMKAGGGQPLTEAVQKFSLDRGDIFLEGVMALNQGYLLSSLLFAAITAEIVDRKFKRAAMWTLTAAALSALGIIHAYSIGYADLDAKYISFSSSAPFIHLAAPRFALMYFIAAIGMCLIPPSDEAPVIDGDEPQSDD